MEKINGDHPIYPQSDWGNQGIKIEGLTKREYFAAKAMEGLLSMYGINGDTTSDAVIIADRLIEDLNKH